MVSSTTPLLLLLWLLTVDLCSPVAVLTTTEEEEAAAAAREATFAWISIEACLWCRPNVDKTAGTVVVVAAFWLLADVTLPILDGAPPAFLDFSSCMAEEPGLNVTDGGTGGSVSTGKLSAAIDDMLSNDCRCLRRARESVWLSSACKRLFVVTSSVLRAESGGNPTTLRLLGGRKSILVGSGCTWYVPIETRTAGLLGLLLRRTTLPSLCPSSIATGGRLLSVTGGGGGGACFFRTVVVGPPDEFGNG